MRAPATTRAVAALAAALLTVGLTGCATSPRVQQAAGGGLIEVAASTNVWNSILSQLGGSHVRATSIIA
ncbi:MAG TPA: hypothetical protein VF714_06910, partial [Jatrophihabitans sp.]